MNLHKESKNTEEEISDGKIKIRFFLFLTDLTYKFVRNNKSKKVYNCVCLCTYHIYTIIYLYMFMYKWNDWKQWYKGQEEGISILLFQNRLRLM